MKSLKTVVVLAALAAAVAGVIVSKHRQGKAAVSEELPVDAPAASQQAALPRLVDFGADKCVPCKMMAPILEELKATQATRLRVEFIDVWKNPEAGENYGIRVIPTQIFYASDGKELFRHEGFFSKEDIVAKWEEFGLELSMATAP